MGLKKQRIASRRAGDMAIETSTIPSADSIVAESDLSCST